MYVIMWMWLCSVSLQHPSCEETLSLAGLGNKLLCSETPHGKEVGAACRQQPATAWQPKELSAAGSHSPLWATDETAALTNTLIAALWETEVRGSAQPCSGSFKILFDNTFISVSIYWQISHSSQTGYIIWGQYKLKMQYLSFKNESDFKMTTAAWVTCPWSWPWTQGRLLVTDTNTPKS